MSWAQLGKGGHVRCPYCGGRGWFNLRGDIDSTNCPVCSRAKYICGDFATVFALAFGDDTPVDQQTIDKISIFRQEWEEAETVQWLTENGLI